MTRPTDESGKRPQQGKAARELNDVIRYTMWSVFELSAPGRDDEERDEQAAEVEELFATLADRGRRGPRRATTSRACGPTPT